VSYLERLPNKVFNRGKDKNSSFIAFSKLTPAGEQRQGCQTPGTAYHRTGVLSHADSSRGLHL